MKHQDYITIFIFAVVLVGIINMFAFMMWFENNNNIESKIDFTCCSKFIYHHMGIIQWCKQQNITTEEETNCWKSVMYAYHYDHCQFDYCPIVLSSPYANQEIQLHNEPWGKGWYFNKGFQEAYFKKNNITRE